PGKRLCSGPCPGRFRRYPSGYGRRLTANAIHPLTKFGTLMRHSFTRRGMLRAVALAGAMAITGFSALTPATAKEFPSKPVTIIVPFSAGGTTDILARIVGQYLGTKFGQSVVVENRDGAGGNIGTQTAARAKADGYTLLMGTVGTHAINPALYSKLYFDLIKDFQPLTRVAMVPNLLVVNPERPYRSVQDLIDYA